jgi:hypothetical protein
VIHQHKNLNYLKNLSINSIHQNNLTFPNSNKNKIKKKANNDNFVKKPNNVYKNYKITILIAHNDNKKKNINIKII